MLARHKPTNVRAFALLYAYVATLRAARSALSATVHIPRAQLSRHPHLKTPAKRWTCAISLSLRRVLAYHQHPRMSNGGQPHVASHMVTCTHWIFAMVAIVSDILLMVTA